MTNPQILIFEDCRMDKIIPIISWRATNIFRAFTLNSFATASIVVVAMIIQQKLNKLTRDEPIEWRSIFITFLGTWLSAWIVFVCLHILFGYGGGMLS